MTGPVAIVGAGPCGLAAALALGRENIPSLVFDRSTVCSAIAGYPTYLTLFSTPEKLELGGLPFHTTGERPTRREALEYYRSVVTRFGLAVRTFEEVESIERQRAAFYVHSRPRDGGVLTTRARAVVIATGYFDAPNLVGVPGEDLPHVSHRFVEGHDAFQRDALVVGGGNSAVECAIELDRCGARVTLVHFGPTFDHVIKPWILPGFDQRVAEGGIRLLWNARVSAIEPARVHLTTAGGPVTLPAQHVYLMTGYTPAPGLLGALGVPFDARTGIPAHDPATMETPVRGVFVAGVLTSGYDANGVFIENGRGHGELIARALAANVSHA